MGTENMDQLVNEIKSYLADGFTEKDFASLWVKVIGPFIDQNQDVLVEGPGRYPAICLGRSGSTHLWFAPAGNIPSNPELIVLGQATSITALDYIIPNLRSLANEDDVRRVLATSIYRGRMLGNLGVMVSFLGLGRVFEQSETLQQEWSNVGAAALASAMEPEGNLFRGNRDSRIMFTQTCMHCATEIVDGQHSVSSEYLDNFLDIYERFYPGHLEELLKEKFFCNDQAKMMVVLSYKLFRRIRSRIEGRYNAYWADFSQGQPDIAKGGKVITWVHHPSTKNSFYNAGGVIQHIQETIDNDELSVNQGLEDYRIECIKFLIKPKTQYNNLYNNKLLHHLFLKYYIHHRYGST